MAKKLIIANWKAKPTSLKDAKRIFGDIKKGESKVNHKKVEVVVCPPYVYLAPLSLSLGNSKVKLGSQDVFRKDMPAAGGSYTGSVSGEMLRDLGVKYVIVGHSERREYSGETNEIINQKIKTALKNNLKVIFCIGEKNRDHKGDYLNFIKDQITEGLDKVPKKLFDDIVIAYEPIWAIGKSGREADNPDSVMQMVIYIRKVLTSIIGNDMALKTPIIYGAAVDSKNVTGFFENSGVQGLLVGHNSLVPKEFNSIIKTAGEVK